jgi:hypothetical protein
MAARRTGRPNYDGRTCMNVITELKTLKLDSSDGPVGAIIMGLRILDWENADSFLREVAERFKRQRASSPPDTCFLLVTIEGDMTAGQFAKEWLQLAAKDPVLGSFMAQMQKAEVLRNTVAGQTLETMSLIKERPK